jgi:hypothetical protein
MSYIKTFMEDYFHREKEIYNPTPIKYMTYNSKTKKFHSANVLTTNQTFEYTVEVLQTEIDFTIFISHPIEEEYFFIDLMDPYIIESKIYDYYDFYDVRTSEINIIQEYTIFVDCDSNIYNIIITKYSCDKKIDTFEVVSFNKLNK